MPELRIFAVIGLLVCLAIVNATASGDNAEDDGSLRDADGNVCPCAANADYSPVCGSNGKTYPNKGILRCDARCKKSLIEVKHHGECAKNEN